MIDKHRIITFLLLITVQKQIQLIGIMLIKKLILRSSNIPSAYLTNLKLTFNIQVFSTAGTNNGNQDGTATNGHTFIQSSEVESFSTPELYLLRMTAREEELWGTLEQDCI